MVLIIVVYCIFCAEEFVAVPVGGPLAHALGGLSYNIKFAILTSETSVLSYIGGTAYVFNSQGKGNAVYLSFSLLGKLDFYLSRVLVMQHMASMTCVFIVSTCQMPLVSMNTVWVMSPMMPCNSRWSCRVLPLSSLESISLLMPLIWKSL